MAHIIVMGAGIGGVSAAYSLRDRLGKDHKITVVNPVDYFQFTPSNPWIASGWRKRKQITVPLARYLQRKHIDFIPKAVTAIDPAGKRLTLGTGDILAYDYLVITTGPKLAFEEVPGLGPEGHTHSVCTVDHAEQAWAAYEKFLEAPGPMVIGAVQGASCFGPAYEFAMILDADLRKRKLRDKVPMTFVTSEPYIGHLGLGGVGDSRGLLEAEMRQRHIKWITNAKVLEAGAAEVTVAEHDDKGVVVREHKLPTRFTMLLPAFKGVEPVAAVKDMCNPRGFVLVDSHQRNPKYPSIYSAGVCVAIPPVEQTPIPTGTPKTGYMIESMVSAIVQNIAAELEGRAPGSEATWNAICLADMGDDGIAFVALPQIPPRNVTWAKTGKWVHYAKVAFEKYFLHKVKSGGTEPIYERYVLKLLGITPLKMRRAS